MCNIENTREHADNVKAIRARLFLFILHTWQCLQAAFLFFSTNLPIFQYFACIFSILQRTPLLYDACMY